MARISRGRLLPRFMRAPLRLAHPSARPIPTRTRHTARRLLAPATSRPSATIAAVIPEPQLVTTGRFDVHALRRKRSDAARGASASVPSGVDQFRHNGCSANREYGRAVHPGAAPALRRESGPDCARPPPVLRASSDSPASAQKFAHQFRAKPRGEMAVRRHYGARPDSTGRCSRSHLGNPPSSTAHVIMAHRAHHPSAPVARNRIPAPS